jgi:UDP-glucose 4-epimerase
MLHCNSVKPYILVTGGLGFIGSHVVVQLLDNDYNVLIFDNLSNSSILVVDKIKQITGKGNNLVFIQGDVRDREHMDQIFSIHSIETVMHFAALKSVNESQKYPDLYHQVNVTGTMNLLEVMGKHNCKNFIYSSSATVYGDSMSPVTEQSRTGINLTCNYAKNKYDVEKYLMENKLMEGWNITVLRYFNPLGAHPSGIIGEDPGSIPNNIFPYLLRVARWTNADPELREPTSPYKIFTIFGDDYDTRDGTCIRDYVHVQDLARAHIDVMALGKMNDKKLRIYNVGTGLGTTVQELVDMLNTILVSKGKKPIEYRVGARRPGDQATCYADVGKIYREIGFKTEFNIREMCIHGLNFVDL